MTSNPRLPAFRSMAIATCLGCLAPLSEPARAQVCQGTGFVQVVHRDVTTPAAAAKGLWTVELSLQFNDPLFDLYAIQGNCIYAEVCGQKVPFVDEWTTGSAPGLEGLLPPLAVDAANLVSQGLYDSDTFVTIGLPILDNNVAALANWLVPQSGSPTPLLQGTCTWLVLQNGEIIVPGGTGTLLGTWLLDPPVQGAQGLAGSYPVGGGLYEVLIARLTMENVGPTVLNVNKLDFTCIDPLGCAVTVDVGFPQCPAPGPIPAPPTSKPMVCPASSGYTDRVYRITGNPTGTPCSWRIGGPGLPTDLWDVCMSATQPACSGGFNDARALAKAFADSINAVAAFLGCGPNQLNATSSCALLPTCATCAFPVGCPPTPPNSALLTVRVGDASGMWDLFVGPAGMLATCQLNGCGTTCVCNPEMSEVPLSGQDCNANGADDIIDLIEGTSVDLNRDDIPDECQASPGDLNGDGVVNGADLGILLGGWGARGSTDLDGNGTTDGADLGILLGGWGGLPS